MSCLDKIHILLDSTYLLPIIGLDVEGIEKALSTLRTLRRRKMAIYYYTPFNILEILGKLSRIEYDRDLVVKGLSLIIEEFTLANPSIEGYIKAMNLRKKGDFKDLIDLLLYTTSLTRNLMFLTRDLELINFLQGCGERLDNILYEDDFIRKYRTL